MISIDTYKEIGIKYSYNIRAVEKCKIAAIGALSGS